MSIREPAWCPDCERSTTTACARHSRELHTWVNDAKEAARAAERQACALICDNWGAKEVARLIRERGDK